MRLSEVDNEGLQRLNEMYIHCVLTLPIEFLIERFNLTDTMISVIREIPPGDLSKLTDINQLLIQVKPCELSKLLQRR